MKATIVLLPGDGIGPEVVREGRTVLDTIAAHFGHSFAFAEHLIGGAAIDATGEALPAATLVACEQADAGLLGAVGGPKWDNPKAKVRPEQCLLAIRKALGLYANLRPVRVHPALAAVSPLKAERIEGVDVLFVWPEDYRVLESYCVQMSILPRSHASTVRSTDRPDARGSAGTWRSRWMRPRAPVLGDSRDCDRAVIREA